MFDKKLCFVLYNVDPERLEMKDLNTFNIPYSTTA